MASALATSIASQLHGAAYTSVATGGWSDPLTWDPLGASGTPDTSAGVDTVAIDGGFTVTWDTAVPLRVTMGGLIDINDGRLDMILGSTMEVGVLGGTGTVYVGNAAGVADSGWGGSGSRCARASRRNGKLAHISIG